MLEIEFIVRSGMADIWDLGDGTILKAFRQIQRGHKFYVNDMRDHNLLTRVICDKEVRAYEIISNRHDLVNYIPKFHKKLDPSFLNTISDVNYVQDAGFIIEKLRGKDYKINHLTSEERSSVDPILRSINTVLEELNVSTIDASCFYTSPENFKLIDFAWWDSSDYECILSQNDCLDIIFREQLQALVI